tara:strand:- start:602 stop:790 length:189 start_codon:yes stop_codon:yes gene_type:complete
MGWAHHINPYYEHYQEKAGKEPIFLCKINKFLRQGGSELIRQLGHGKGFVQKINAFIQATIV